MNASRACGSTKRSIANGCTSASGVSGARPNISFKYGFADAVAQPAASIEPRNTPSGTRSKRRSSRGAGIEGLIIELFMFATSLFRDQVALVTGGGTGLGLAIARRLGGLGARVAIASRNQQHL